MSEICRDLHLFLARRTRYSFPFVSDSIPSNGIYVLFEKGEKAHGVDRIVRVGTHTGENQLRSRLKQHFVNKNKDRSIFRKNIGRALLNRDKDPFLEQWERDLTTRAARDLYGTRIDRVKLAETEDRVTEYMQTNFQFCVGHVKTKEERLYWEAKLISTISSCDECHPSAGWLGLSSPKQKIRDNGLWQVNELDGEPMSKSEFSRFRAL